MKFKALAKFKRILVRGYIAATVCMLFIIIFVFGRHWGFRLENGLEDYINVSDSWTDGNGQPVKLSALEEREDGTHIYFQLPQMEKGASLVFRSLNVYLQAYLDGELIYETDSLELNSFAKSPGSIWNMISFSPKQAGKQLELRITAAYPGEGLTINYVYWGDRAAIVLAAIGEKLTGVIVSITICLVGLFMILLDIPINKGKKRKNHNLRCLGYFSLCIGLWCLLETNIPQFFGANPQFVQVADNMLLILAVLPLVWYAEWTYGILRYRLVRILCVLELIFLLCCVIFPFAGVSDWHELLPIARILLAVWAAGFISFTTGQNLSVLFSKKKRRSANVWSSSLQLLGIGAVGLTTALELIRFNAVEHKDSAFLLRFGLLAFIICYAIGGQLSTYHLISQGMEYDSVHKLAYSDVLTQLENRTAYLEQLEECVKKHVQELGIVFLDINSLKFVNDTYGHDMGDVMIQMASKVIGGSFGAFGRAFRIGGDEFCVILDGNVQEKYDQAVDIFEKGVREANEKNTYEFTLQIAHGFACCAAESMEAVETASRLADERMYQNKMQLKGQNQS